MADRRRIIYQSDAVYCSNSTGTAGDAGGIPPAQVTQMHRVQSIDYSFEVNRTDVNEIDKLAALERVILEEPTVSFSMNYLLADGWNESGVGLTVATASPPNCLSGILANNPEAEKNFYIVTVPEGLDAVGYDVSANAGTPEVVGIGNAFLTSYSVSASVGEFPSADMEFEASNFTISKYLANGIRNPAIVTTGTIVEQYTGRVTWNDATTGTLSVAALRPGDITLDFGAASAEMGGPVMPGNTADDATNTAMHVQSFTLDVPLSRTPLQRLGNPFAFSREIDVPINVSMSVSANLASVVTGSLVNLICNATQERNITVTMKDACGANTNLVFTLKGATLDSESFANAVGDGNKTVDLTFNAQIGGGNDTTKGLFITTPRLDEAIA